MRIRLSVAALAAVSLLTMASLAAAQQPAQPFAQPRGLRRAAADKLHDVQIKDGHVGIFPANCLKDYTAFPRDSGRR